MVKVKVLGTGCKNCQRLYGTVTETVRELGLAAVVEKVEDLAAIMSFGVMSTPALVVNGRVVLSGRVPGKEEVKKLLQGA